MLSTIGLVVGALLLLIGLLKPLGSNATLTPVFERFAGVPMAQAGTQPASTWFGGWIPTLLGAAFLAAALALRKEQRWAHPILWVLGLTLMVCAAFYPPLVRALGAAIGVLSIASLWPRPGGRRQHLPASRRAGGAAARGSGRP
jgi:hypothetical protein